MTTEHWSPEQLEGRLRGIAMTSQERRRLESVIAILGPLTHGARLQFWLNPRASLSGLTPMEAVARGQVAAVSAAAEAFTDS